MVNWLYGDRYQLHILESFDQMKAIEDLQREVWPGDRNCPIALAVNDCS